MSEFIEGLEEETMINQDDLTPKQQKKYDELMKAKQK